MFWVYCCGWAPLSKRPAKWMLPELLKCCLSNPNNHVYCSSNTVTTKTVNQPKPSETTYNQPETIRNHPKLSRNHPKPSKITWNYLQSTENFPKVAITSPTTPKLSATPTAQRETSSLFYCCWVWTWVHIQESKIRKRCQKP